MMKRKIKPAPEPKKKKSKLDELRAKQDILVKGDEDMMISRNKFDLMMELLK